MTFLKVILILFAVCFLISRIRLGGAAAYEEGVFFLEIIAGPAKISVLPAKPKVEEKKSKKEKPAKTEKPAGKGKTKGKGKLPPIGELVTLALEALGSLRRKIRIDELTLHLIWGSEDPASAAVGYGKAQAVMHGIWPLIANNFHVKKHDLGVAVDFDRTKPDISGRAALTFTVGQILSFALIFGIKFLRLWRRGKKTQQNKQEVKNNERAEPSYQ